MSEYGGFLFVFDEAQRAEMLQTHIEEDRTFSDTISAPDWEYKAVELCLISFDGEGVHYAALARRGKNVATYKSLIKFSNFVKLQAIHFAEIYDASPDVGKATTEYATLSSRGVGKRMPPEVWRRLMIIVNGLRPESAQALTDLEKLLQESKATFSERRHEIMAQQKDTVGLALTISGFDRAKELAREGEPAPALWRLQNAKLPEDKAIDHDMSVFGDWSRIKRYQVYAAELTRQDEKLTVVNANRTSIEETLGVDLLYYHHRFESYVMIQYKRMRFEGRKLIYRFNHDKSYQSEIAKMRQFEQSYPIDNRGISREYEYRLHSGTFYFKLCHPVTFTPLSTELIKGRYIPLDYWEPLVNSQDIVGPRGGVGVGSHNVRRYLNNSLFIQLVQAGWIGSKIADTSILTDIIHESIEGDKSLTLAAFLPT